MTFGEETSDEFEIAYHILAYLHAHPDAQDTLEGIVEWWLLEQKIARQTEIVKNALADLSDRGLIVSKIGADSRIHYSIERRKKKEIEALLKDWPGDR